MIWIILFLSLGLRLITLNQSLWLDEAINVVSAQRWDFFSFVTQYPIGDFHPPAYFALLWIWGHLFGFSEISVRLPSVILGVLTVGFTYLIGKELGNKKAALTGALLMAVAPLHVYYSQEARMYSLAAFSVTLSFYFLLRLIKNQKYSYPGYILSSVLVLYSDYVVYLVFPAQLLFLLWFSRASIKKVIRGWLVASLLLIPWIWVFPQQLLTGTQAASSLSGWKDVVGGSSVKDLALVWVKMLIGRISFDNKIVYGGVASFLSVLWGLCIWGGNRNVNNITGLLFLWIIVPVGLSWLISFYVPILSYFRMLFILPAFYLLLAYGISKLPKVISATTIVLLTGASLVFLSIYYLNSQFQREDWKGAVSFIKANVGPDDLVVFENNHVPYSFAYYADSLPQVEKGLVKLPAKTLGDTIGIEQLQVKHRVYVFEYLVDITDPQKLLEKKIVQLGFTQKEVYNFNGVGFIKMYEK